MNAFSFPQPGERKKDASISIPERTLAALYALALVGMDHLTVNTETFYTPQCGEALDEVLMMLPEDLCEAAHAMSHSMEQDLRNEYPF